MDNVQYAGASGYNKMVKDFTAIVAALPVRRPGPGACKQWRIQDSAGALHAATYNPALVYLNAPPQNTLAAAQYLAVEIMIDNGPAPVAILPPDTDTL